MTHPNPRPLAEMLEAYAERIAKTRMPRYGRIEQNYYEAGFLAACSLLLPCVEALEWYDNVHRNHWAIDLNDLDVKAQQALSSLRDKLEGK